MKKIMLIIILLMLSSCAKIEVKTFNPETNQYCEASYISFRKDIAKPEGGACGAFVGAENATVKELEGLLPLIRQIVTEYLEVL